MDILSSTANSISQSHRKTIKTPLALPTHHFSLEETIAAPRSLSKRTFRGDLFSHLRSCYTSSLSTSWKAGGISVCHRDEGFTGVFRTRPSLSHAKGRTLHMVLYKWQTPRNFLVPSAPRHVALPPAPVGSCGCTLVSHMAVKIPLPLHPSGFLLLFSLHFFFHLSSSRTNQGRGASWMGGRSAPHRLI